MQRCRTILLSAVLLVAFMLGNAAAVQAFEWRNLFSRFGVNKETSLASTPAGPALKEALKIGVERSVDLLSREGGYFNNENVKIPMPRQLELLDKSLRKIGMGAQVDNFVLSMNRAAEEAAPHARDIFVDSITEMTINDAEKILHGSDTEATQYLDRTSRERLTSAFGPIVQKRLSSNGAVRQYRALVERFRRLPFMDRLPLPEVEPYVVDKALDGLFYVIGQEEKKIRQDPMARTTSLLKTVFRAQD